MKLSQLIPAENQVPITELQAACRRIGVASNEQLEWILGVVNDKTELTAGRIQTLRVEIGIFSRGVGDMVPHLKQPMLVLSEGLFPTIPEARAIAAKFKELVTLWNKQENFTIEAKTHYRFFNGQFSENVWDIPTDCTVRLGKLLVEHGSDVRQCETCSNWFLKYKANARFCSEACGTAQRVARWKKKQQ